MYDVASEHLAGYAAALLALPVIWLGLRVLRAAADRHLPWAKRAWDGYRASSPIARLAALLMLLSAAIHLALIPGHDGGLTPLLFAVDGAGLILLSLAAFVSTWWRRWAAVWLAANTLAYGVWLVAGWETPDQVGISCKLIELLALGLVMRLAVPRKRTWPRRIWRAVALPLVTTVTTAGIWIGGLAHPDALHSHAGAVLQPVALAASADQRAAAVRLLADTRTSLARYHDPAVAMAAGFKPGPLSDADPLLHFANQTNAGVVLDPARPQDLVYVRTRHGLRLVGAMFQMQRVGQWGPDPGGPLTQWHQHEGICFTPFGFELSFATPFWSCPLGAMIITTPPMLHVWIVDNPKGGPFAADLDPSVQRALAQQ